MLGGKGCSATVNGVSPISGSPWICFTSLGFVCNLLVCFLSMSSWVDELILLTSNFWGARLRYFPLFLAFSCNLARLKASASKPP
jgi:hypothetical protein